MKLIIAIFMFLCIGAFFIISNEQLALNEEESFEKFGQKYSAWLETLFLHGKQITGYIINSDWLPQQNNASIPK